MTVGSTNLRDVSAGAAYPAYLRDVSAGAARHVAARSSISCGHAGAARLHVMSPHRQQQAGCVRERDHRQDFRASAVKQ